MAGEGEVSVHSGGGGGSGWRLMAAVDFARSRFSNGGGWSRMLGIGEESIEDTSEIMREEDEEDSMVIFEPNWGH